MALYYNEKLSYYKYLVLDNVFSKSLIKNAIKNNTVEKMNSYCLFKGEK